MSKILSSIILLVLLLPAPVMAQWLPSGPVQLFDGRVRLAGDVSATFGEKDHEAYFNYTDYERNALRMLRASLSGLWQPASRLAVVGEVRSENLEHLGAYAVFVRVRPFDGLPLDIQAGRIPPVFGAFGRRAYQSDRILIGYPLAHQYLTSIRADAVPATADDLLRMRGRGWRSSFPIGSAEAAPGVPLISAFRWDTGVQAALTTTRIDAALSVTTGTLSNPKALDDDNGGKQLSGRVAVRPLTGLVLGGSASRGDWISNQVPHASGPRAQTALGADAEYSRDHWLLRGELIWSRWGMPFTAAPVEGNTIEAVATWIEGRYRLTPRLSLTARADRLGFSKITGQLFNGAPTAWDAPVTRMEAGAGYLLQRNLVLRIAVQTNRRDGGLIRKRTFGSAQVGWWF